MSITSLNYAKNYSFFKVIISSKITIKNKYYLNFLFNVSKYLAIYWSSY